MPLVYQRTTATRNEQKRPSYGQHGVNSFNHCCLARARVELFLGVIVTALRPTPRSVISQCLRHESQRFNKILAVLICCIISLIAVALWPIIWITNIRAAAAVESLPPNKEQLSLFGGGNGDSFETAVIVNAENSFVGVEAEYAYIANQCGEPYKDWKLQSQGLRERGGKPYDVLKIALNGGATRTFYFNITNFFPS
jgi:hypothetical protein